MSEQLNFDLSRARKLRDQGLACVEANNGSWISEARSIALLLAARQGEVTIDDVLKLCPRPDYVHPNATGSVFKDKRFLFVGYAQTSKISSHARRVCRWSLV